MLGQDVGPGSVGCDTVVSPTPFLLETNNIYASQAPYNEGKTVRLMLKPGILAPAHM